MKDSFSLFLRLSILGLLLPICFQGCALPLSQNVAVTPDRAFISHAPGTPEPGKLRLAVKDIIDMEGTVTTAGSQYLAEQKKVATRDAALMGPARRAGVQIVGKTNLTEFALGTSGMNDYFGTPVNPLDRGRIPGGSSSGSAVAVANNEADVAFGSDTAGSIRVPAACCGILGLKTTYGLVSLDGVFPLSPRFLDTVGPMAKDVPRLAQGMELLSPGFNGRYEAAKKKAPTGQQIRVGRFYVKGTDSKIDRAIDAALQKAGFQIVPLDKSFQADWDKAQSNGSTLAVAESWSSDRKYLGKLGVSLTTQATIRLGQVQFKTVYKSARADRRAWRNVLRRVLNEVDFIALPTLNTLPPRKPLFTGRTALFEAQVLAVQNTVAVNYAGNPAIAIPIPLQRLGFPVTSLQLIGSSFKEAELVNAARLITMPEPILPPPAAPLASNQ